VRLFGKCFDPIRDAKESDIAARDERLYRAAFDVRVRARHNARGNEN
jgi:hypothetical protein